MDTSILTSTKKVLGLEESYTVFDVDVTMHINSVFSILTQMGIGPEEGFMIEDADAVWGDYEIPTNWLNLVRTLLYLRVRMLFDPPTTSFLLDAMTKQIAEYEWRLSVLREGSIPLPVEVVTYDCH